MPFLPMLASLFTKHHRASSKLIHSLIIAGSGPAGSTAALYAARAGFSPLVFHGQAPGGQLTTTTELENFPGWKGTGPDLVAKIEEQATNAGATYSYEEILDCDLSSPVKTIRTDSNEYSTNALIIATGATARYLNVPGEQQLIGKGVSACAVCDGPLYKGKHVIVVGGGDTAIEEALFLQKVCRSVKMIVRGERLTASTIMKERIAKSGVEILWNREVAKVNGSKKVEGVTLTNPKNQKEDMKCDGIFVAVGHTPATKAFMKWLKTDQHGYFVTKGSPETDIPGVFVAGDCADPLYRQAITAAGSGCQAALLAEKYLTSLKIKRDV